MKKLRTRIISIVLTLALALSLTAAPVSFCAAATKASTKTTSSTSKKYTVCKTYKEAAKQLRTNMVNRKRYTRVKYTFTSKNPKQLAKNFSSKVYKQAIQHTGGPRQGDSLWLCHEGYTAVWKLTQSSKTKKYTVSVEYDFDYRTTAKEETALTNEVNRILTSLNLKDASDNSDKKKATISDYNKILAIYDYVTTHVKYANNGESDTKNYTAYKAAVKGEAVCQGYALLMYRLLLASDIPCRVFTAYTAAGDGHAWNIVKLDGKWYNLDATWDSTRSDHRYFLRGTQDFGHEIYTKVDDRLASYTIEPYRYATTGQTPRGPIQN